MCAYASAFLSVISVHFCGTTKRGGEEKMLDAGDRTYIAHGYLRVLRDRSPLFAPFAIAVCDVHGWSQVTAAHVTRP